MAIPHPHHPTRRGMGVENPWPQGNQDMRREPEALTPAKPSKAKRRSLWARMVRPTVRASPIGTHKVEEADQHLPLAHTVALGELCAALSVPSFPGSLAAGPPLSAELPLSSSGAWRPPEQAPAQRGLTLPEHYSSSGELTSQGPGDPPPGAMVRERLPPSWQGWD